MINGEYLNGPCLQPKNVVEEELVYYAEMRTKGEKIDLSRYDVVKVFPPYNQLYQVFNNSAVLCIEGMPFYKAGIYDIAKGAFLIEDAIKAVTKAERDQDIFQIIIWVCGMGGSIYEGIFELGERIHQVNNKPCYALSPGPAVSGHYVFASAPKNGFFVSGPFVRSGSIGVCYRHMVREDTPEVKTVECTIGEFKTVGSPYSQATPATVSYQENQLQYAYKHFINTVARYRKMTPEAVMEVADGKTFYGEEAIAAGLVNGYFDVGKWFVDHEFIPIFSSSKKQEGAQCDE